MHVGLILEHSDVRRGGAERYASDLTERLRLHGHEVTTCARTGPAARPVRAWPKSLRPRFYARAFLPYLRDAGADVVLALNAVPGCDVFQPRMGIVSRAFPPHWEPLPQPLRAIRMLNPARRVQLFCLDRFEAQTVQPPCRFLAASPLVAQHFRERYPALPDPPVLRTGVDLERFTPAASAASIAQENGAPLLFAAHSYEAKGLRTVLHALRELGDRTLVVVGEGEQRRFRRLAARLGVAGRVQWRGHEGDMPRLLREAACLVHPTFYDTAARVVLEALASGTPAITTVRDGNADLAREGGGAALEDPRDAATLVEAVRRVLRIHRAERAERARAVAELHPNEAWLDRAVEAITCASTS